MRVEDHAYITLNGTMLTIDITADPLYGPTADEEKTSVEDVVATVEALRDLLEELDESEMHEPEEYLDIDEALYGDE